MNQEEDSKQKNPVFNNNDLLLDHSIFPIDGQNINNEQMGTGTPTPPVQFYSVDRMYSSFDDFPNLPYESNNQEYVNLQFNNNMVATSSNNCLTNSNQYPTSNEVPVPITVMPVPVPVMPVAIAPILPPLVLSLNAWPGYYNFEAKIPIPVKKVKGKHWKFSNMLNRIYVDMNTVFPIDISMDFYPHNAVITLCLVYTDSSKRTLSVRRCITHSSQETDQNLGDHILRMDGGEPNYYCRDRRQMIDVALGQPPAGENNVTFYCSLGCHTSCIGGPNRKLFSILLTAKDNTGEIGRQVIHTKCCAGPKRDMGNDEENFSLKHVKPDIKPEPNMEQIRLISNQLTVPKTEKISKKRKTTKRLLSDEDEDEFVEIAIPKIYLKSVKKLVNELHFKRKVKLLKVKFPKIYHDVSSSTEEN